MRPPILLFINVCHYLIVLKTKKKGVHLITTPACDYEQSPLFVI